MKTARRCCVEKFSPEFFPQIIIPYHQFNRLLRNNIERLPHGCACGRQCDPRLFFKQANHGLTHKFVIIHEKNSCAVHLIRRRTPLSEAAS